jgi:hypothetical protein
VGPRHRRLSRGVFLALLFWGIHGAFTVLDPLQWLWAATVAWAGIRTAATVQPGRLLRFFMVFLLLTAIAMDFASGTLLWLFWATLLCFLRLDHPPTRDVHIPLDWRRRLLGWLALALFLLTFVPKPLQFTP